MGRTACVYSVRWAALDKCDCVCMCVSVLGHFHLVYCASLSVLTCIHACRHVLAYKCAFSYILVLLPIRPSVRNSAGLLLT